MFDTLLADRTGLAAGGTVLFACRLFVGGGVCDSVTGVKSGIGGSSMPALALAAGCEARGAGELPFGWLCTAGLGSGLMKTGSPANSVASLRGVAGELGGFSSTVSSGTSMLGGVIVGCRCTEGAPRSRSLGAEVATGVCTKGRDVINAS